jgi:hypothetical protein
MTEPVTPLERIAGHDFDFNGVCQGKNTAGELNCSLPHRKLSEILSATKENLGQLGWAHIGTLNQTELDEIIKKREKMWSQLAGG